VCERLSTDSKNPTRSRAVTNDEKWVKRRYVRHNHHFAIGEGARASARIETGAGRAPRHEHGELLFVRNRRTRRVVFRASGRLRYTGAAGPRVRRFGTRNKNDESAKIKKKSVEIRNVRRMKIVARGYAAGVLLYGRHSS